MSDPTVPALEEFREFVATWLKENAPTRPIADNEIRTAGCEFQASLNEAGLAGLTWPTTYSGRGLSQEHLQVYSEEADHFALPNWMLGVSQNMVGPTIIDLGTPEQKSRYLPRIVNGDDVWCQLFSEPGAGSDLAGLRTKAVKVDGGWRLNGQKVWTSAAQYANCGVILARTSPELPKHSGITMFIIDMTQPGVLVRPLRDMTGRSPFNEVFLTDALVGDDSVIGEVDAGWAAATTMLGHERLSISRTRQNRSRGLSVEFLTSAMHRTGRNNDPIAKDRLAELHVHERALQLFNARLTQEVQAGIDPQSRGSIGKLSGALQLLRAAALIGDVLGTAAVETDPEDSTWGDLQLGINSAPANSIAGGTNEIQRSIISERVLGLPREPSADRGVPFNEIRTSRT
ncbi:acyl-CoA dehydrogenase family protein [Rhodococcus olei]|uniref:Acyl-CoA dehydrogenase family protein n=1 Tax=Rhodococcus olei TaxID=2161675 RepID=A0ABP8NYJ5_9NOCA